MIDLNTWPDDPAERRLVMDARIRAAVEHERIRSAHRRCIVCQTVGMFSFMGTCLECGENEKDFT